jgi:hypothetical protein
MQVMKNEGDSCAWIIVRIYTIIGPRDVTSKTHQTLTCTNVGERSIEEAV